MTTATIPHFTVHDRLRKARESAGLDQDQLAERIKRTRQTVSNWERGSTSLDAMNLKVMAAWADACHVPLWWIFSGDDGGADVANLPTGRDAVTRASLALAA